MAHPFAIMFDKALKKSLLSDENLVLAEAEKLKDKGYSPTEIYGVLKKLQASLIQDDDIEEVGEALEEFSRYLDLDGEDEED